MAISKENLDRQERQAEDGIFSDNFGGLNTVASNLNCPYQDSPLLLNCDIDLSGKIVKRKGTKLLLEETKSAVEGYSLLPFITGLGYTFLIEKFDKDINLYETDNDTITSVMTKTNVWDTEGGKVRANYTRTAEIEPRIIFATGVNQPVQLKFVEQQEVLTGVESPVILNDASRFEFATTSNILVYKNRVRVTPSGVSYAGGNLTLTGISGVANDVIDVLLVTWQHFVDALAYTGNRFTKQLTRFNVTKTDQNLALPATLIDEATDKYTTIQYTYHVEAYKNTVWNNRFNLVNNREPSTANDYTPGDGGRYVYAAGNKVNPSPLFFTFGDINVSTDPTQVVAMRKRLLDRLNGAKGVVGTSLKVYIDGVLKPQSITPGASVATYGAYYLYNTSGAVETSTANRGYVIAFEAASTIGVPETSLVEIVHTTTSFIGSSATTEVSPYRDGACFPCYGLGEFSDYSSRNFPRNVAVFEGRLVFSGFPSDALRVIFSEVFDKTKAGVNFASFQIDPLTTEATDPVDLFLNSRSDDYVTGLAVWQRSLFVFTRQAVFRITGGESGFSNTSKITVRVSDTGLVNAYSLVSTDRTILYLSDIGVFDLFLGLESDEYVANERSLKIRNRFGVTSDPSFESLAWMGYDNNSQKVYVGLPSSKFSYTSYYLYVFNTFRESWTEYETPGRFRFYYATPYQDRTKGVGFLGSCVTKNDSSNIPTNRGFLKFDSDKYLDFERTSTGNGVTTTYNLAFDRRLFTLTTTDKIYEYSVSPEATVKSAGFDLLPMTTVQDLSVEIETYSGSGSYQTLTFGTDYFKRPNGTIYLFQNPGNNRLLRIRQRLPVTDTPEGQDWQGVTSPLAFHDSIAVFVDNDTKRYSTDFTTTISGTYQISFNIAPANNSVIIYGRCYQAYYFSPLITLQSLLALKRVKFVYLYFDNFLGQDTFKVSDVNTSSSQDPEQIVGEPKQRVNANISISYESDSDTENEMDLYGYENLIFDESLFDVYLSTNQYRRYALFKESLLGIGYSYQIIVWSFDETVFNLSGYQISNMINAERYISWNQ